MRKIILLSQKNKNKRITAHQKQQQKMQSYENKKMMHQQAIELWVAVVP